MWKTLPFIPDYEVSSNGVVRRITPSKVKRNTSVGRHLKPRMKRDGRLHVTLTDIHGKTKTYSIHRLVALAHIGDPPSGKPHVLHWDGDPMNNAVGNLRWGSPKENQEDRSHQGTRYYNEDVNLTKFSDALVADIRAHHASGYNTVELARMFGVSQSHVSKIVRGVLRPETIKIEFTDFDLTLKHFADHQLLRRTIQRMVDRDVEVRGKEAKIPGVTVKESRRAA